MRHTHMHLGVPFSDAHPHDMHVFSLLFHPVLSATTSGEGDPVLRRKRTLIRVDERERGRRESDAVGRRRRKRRRRKERLRIRKRRNTHGWGEEKEKKKQEEIEGRARESRKENMEETHIIHTSE